MGVLCVASEAAGALPWRDCDADLANYGRSAPAMGWALVAACIHGRRGWSPEDFGHGGTDRGSAEGGEGDGVINLGLGLG